MAVAAKKAPKETPRQVLCRELLEIELKHKEVFDRMDAIKTELKAIAKTIARGELDFAALIEMPADDAHQALTAVHGIGPWTADIYLLFCLGHADAWPAGDLALQEAAQLLFKLKARPTAEEMLPLAEAWRPWRGAAAYMLWTYYRAAKQRDGAPIAAVDKKLNATRERTARARA